MNHKPPRLPPTRASAPFARSPPHRVNAVTLRAWQRRAARLVQPARTEKGHRLYSEQDIRQIGEILSWLERG